MLNRGKYIECKNWENFLPQYEEQFVKQFAHTLGNIQEITNMEYYWARMKPDIEKLKTVLNNQVDKLNDQTLISLEKRQLWFNTSGDVTLNEINTFVNKFYNKIMK